MSNALTKVAAEVGKDVGKSAARKLLPYCPPYVVMAAAYPLADILHHELGGSLWATIGLPISSTVLTLAAWYSASSRSMIARVHATASTGVGMAWLTAVTVAGLTGPDLKAGGFVGGTLSLAWTIRRLNRNTGSGEGHGGAGDLFAALKLPGIKIRRTKVEPNKLTADLQLPGGQILPEQVAEAAPRIAGALGLPRSSVRFVADPERSADRGSLIIVPEDVLKDSPTWPGPSHWGGTMADPCRVGVGEDSADLLIYCASDPTGQSARQLPHISITGVTRSGKGVGARNLLSEIATRRESSVIMIDTAKASQNLGAAEMLFDWFIRDVATARRLFKALPRIIRQRSDFLGAHKYDNWEPGCGINHLIIWIEEAGELMRDFAAAVDIVAAAASVGIQFIISIQRPSHDNMNTSVRTNLTGSWVFGTAEKVDTQMVLSDEVILAGAEPHVWGNKKPGYNYYVGPGVDEERWAMPQRTYGTPFGVTTRGAMSPAEALRVWIQRCIDAGVRDGLDELTVRLMPEEYAERTRLDGTPVKQLLPAGPSVALPVAAVAAAPAAAGRVPIAPAGPANAAAVAAADAVASAEQDAQEQDEFEELPEEIRAFIVEALTESIEEEPVNDGGVGPLSAEEFAEAAAVLAEVELPEEDEEDEEDNGEVDGWARLAGGPQKRMESGPARSLLRGRLIALDAEQPGREIRFDDIASVITETGLTRAWGRSMLREFLETDLLEQPGRGVYRVLRQPASVGS